MRDPGKRCQWMGLGRMQKLSLPIARRGLLVLLGLLGLFALGLHAAAAKAAGPTLTDLALEWSRGRYVSPMICKFEGEALRAQRRALIAPGEKKHSKTLLQFRFYRMQLPAVPSSCFSVLGVQEFDIEGSIVATVAGKSRPDSLERDFKEMLERKGGIELTIQDSHLKFFSFGEAAPASDDDADNTAAQAAAPAATAQDAPSQPTPNSVRSQATGNTVDPTVAPTTAPTPAVAAPREVQVKSARLSTVPPGSDLARTLSDYQDFPQYQLDLELADGQFLTIPLVKMGLR